MIYLDNAATTEVSKEVLKGMMPFLEYAYGNPSSIHMEGRKARKAIENARHAIAKTINARPEQIIFTSGATEANNMAFLSGIKGLNPAKDPHRLTALTTKIEHKAVLKVAEHLKYDYPNIFTHGTTSEEILYALRASSEIGFLSCMYINNEIGYKFSIPKIGKRCRDLNVKFHTDASQAYGKVDIDVERDCIDYMSVSGHKIHAPKGVGFLYARDPESVKPIMFGGGQERGFRPGTENVAAIVGLGIAAEMACKDYDAKAEKREALLGKFAHDIGLFMEEKGIAVINKIPWARSGILNMRFDGVDGETLVMALSARDIMVSAGSACNSREAVPSHVLKAIGLSDDEARSSIRISVSESNTMEEIETAAKEVANMVTILRNER